MVLSRESGYNSYKTREPRESSLGFSILKLSDFQFRLADTLMSASLTAADSPGRSLVVALRPALLKYFLRKCRNPAEAEDLAQDVLERALAHTLWESAEQAKGYIFRIAVNRWHDRNRRCLTRGSVVEWDDAATYAQAEEISVERVLNSKQELHVVVAALQELSERTRDVFMLDRLEHLKHGEIAQIFGISVSAVEKHVSKAVAHLARRAARSS
jgi:RNA polymerase sigma factor (sigma-70 family)